MVHSFSKRMRELLKVFRVKLRRPTPTGWLWIEGQEEPLPVSRIFLETEDGLKTFYPDDIKA